jgi:hypothetical protein
VPGWKAVENDQVHAAPTSFAGKIGGGWTARPVCVQRVWGAYCAYRGVLRVQVRTARQGCVQHLYESDRAMAV